MSIYHREEWMPSLVTQSNYPSLGEVYFLGWYGTPWLGASVVAIFKIKYKVI